MHALLFRLRINRHPIVHAGVAILSLTALAACTEPADAPPEPGEAASQAAMVEAGRLNYMTYCLNCHGDEGKGDGPLNELINMKPSDLTALAAANDGEFPEEWVDGVIRGYDEEVLLAHGDREMPIWEAVWQEQAEGDNVVETVDTRVAEIIAYLKTIQG